MKYFAIGFLLLSWLMPLHFLPWVSWHSEVLAFFAVFLAAWVVLVRGFLGQKKKLIGIPSLSLPFVLLVLVVCIQTATGLINFTGDALVLVLYLSSGVICLILGYASNAQVKGVDENSPHLRMEPSALVLLAKALTLGAFCSAIVAFAQVFELYEQFTWINRMQYLRRPGGNLGQPNQLATLLLMGVVSLVLLYESRRLSAVPAALACVVLCAGLVFTESRTGVLSFTLVSGWWFLNRKRVNSKLSLGVVALTNFFFLALFWKWPAIFTWIQQGSSGGSSLGANTGAGSRLVVWPQLLEAVSLHPWFGWGLGEVSEAQNAVVHAYTASESYSYAHNILLDIAVGAGVPLAALLAVWAGLWFWRRTRAAIQLYPWYCLAAALPVAVHSMLEFPFAYAYFLAPLMFLLGAMEGMLGSKPILRINLGPAAACLLLVSSFAAWSLVEYVAIEEDFRVARFEALHVGRTPTEYQRPKVILLTQLDALLGGARISPRPGMGSEELALAKAVALRYPWSATQNRYALALALNGRPDEARRQLLVMKVVHGEKNYKNIKASWSNLAATQYPQLHEIKLP